MAGLCGLVQSDRAANTHDQYKQNADGCGQQLHLMSVLTRCVSVKCLGGQLRVYEKKEDV